MTTAPGLLSREPDLLYSDDEEQLRQVLRALLAERCPPAAVLEAVERPDATVAGLWQALVGEVGAAGLPIAEEHGGAGASWRETAVVLEELGRAVAPVPYFSSAVHAAALAEALRADPLSRELAAGTTAAVVGDPAAPIAVTTTGDALSGAARGVPDAARADLLLVVLDAQQIAVVRAGTPGVVVDPVVSLDMTRPLADVRLGGARIEATYEAPAADPGALGRGHAVALAVLASEQVGVADWCLDTTVGYLTQRRQFGRLIGSYQALQHRCADLWVRVTQARAVARYAAWCAATADPDIPVAARLAQSYCGEVAVHAAQECVQLHGGIGFTWEYPAHLYLKRARAAAVMFGAGHEHRRLLAPLVDLPER